MIRFDFWSGYMMESSVGYFFEEKEKKILERVSKEGGTGGLNALYEICYSSTDNEYGWPNYSKFYINAPAYGGWEHNAPLIENVKNMFKSIYCEDCIIVDDPSKDRKKGKSIHKEIFDEDKVPKVLDESNILVISAYPSLNMSCDYGLDGLAEECEDSNEFIKTMRELFWDRVVVVTSKVGRPYIHGSAVLENTNEIDPKKLLYVIVTPDYDPNDTPFCFTYYLDTILYGDDIAKVKEQYNSENMCSFMHYWLWLEKWVYEETEKGNLKLDIAKVNEECPQDMEFDKVEEFKVAVVDNKNCNVYECDYAAVLENIYENYEDD